jgi:hypothetical protein
MDSEKPTPEFEQAAKDVTAEFLAMDYSSFKEYLKTIQSEPAISITINWDGIKMARKVKAFIEKDLPGGPKRYASIRATKAQKDQEPNVFTSGVQWIEVTEI